MDAIIAAINYNRDIGWAGHKVAELARAGVSTLKVTYDEGKRPLIGTFQQVFDPERFLALALAVEKLPEIRIDGLLEPGARITSIGLRAHGAAMPKTVATFLTTPPEAEAFVKAIETMLSELKLHPVGAIAGRVDSEETRVVRGQRWSFSLNLTNTGHKAVNLVHPAAQGTGWTGIRVRLSDPKGDGAPQLDVRGEDIVSSTPVAEGAAVVLAPGEALVVNAHVLIDVKPGPYGTRVEAHLFSKDGLPDIVSGTLAIDGDLLKVSR